MRYATDESEKKCIDDVKNYGLHIISVAGDEHYPGFAYTVGLFENYLHPEIIIIGLRESLVKVLLNNIGYEIKNGREFTAGEFHEGVLDNFVCYFGTVPKAAYMSHVGWDRWFYSGDEFPLIQCVYPTVGGKFPWQPDFPPEARSTMKMLIAPPKEH